MDYDLTGDVVDEIESFDDTPSNTSVSSVESWEGQSSYFRSLWLAGTHVRPRRRSRCHDDVDQTLSSISDPEDSSNDEEDGMSYITILSCAH